MEIVGRWLMPVIAVYSIWRVVVHATNPHTIYTEAQVGFYLILLVASSTMAACYWAMRVIKRSSPRNED